MSNAGSNVEKATPVTDQALSPRGQGSSASTPAKRSGDLPTIVSNGIPVACPAAANPADRILEGRVMPGDRLGPFELVDYVGGGGMGRVFRAIDTQLGRTVAIKVLPPEQAAEPDAAQRFQNEAQSAARLDHENIARVYGVGQDQGLFYIIFEFVEGENIRERVDRNGRLPLGEAIGYTVQIAEALAHADARSVVHRDIKPSNVLITPEGRVKLIDMGLARLRQAQPAGADLTVSGVTLGTFDYISPEQARDPRAADVRSDIYSLGCTLFFMLAGQPPFADGTMLQKLVQHQVDQPPDIRQFRPEMPERVSQVLCKMMAKEPERRYSNPADLAADLLRLAGETGVQPVGPADKIWLAPPEPPTGFFHRHLSWIVPVAVLAAVVLFLHVYWSPSSPDGSAVGLVDGREPVTQAPGRAAPGDAGSASAASSRDGAGRSASSDDSVVAPPGSATSGTAASSKKPLDRDDAPDAYFDIMPDEEVGAASPWAAGAKANGQTASNAGGRPEKASPTAAAKRPGVLVVGDSLAGANAYTSLGAACAAAQDGDEIELRFDGPREERPIKIANMQLTVRAGEGYRPRIIFRPTEINPVRYARSMFTLTAGRLTFINVALELDVPWDVPADNWTLLELWGGQALRLERCSLVVRNTSEQFAAYHPAAMFLRARPAPDAKVVTDAAPSATPLATVELVDCIARGEAAFLNVEELQPVSLLWDNGLLVTSDPFLVAGGAQLASKPDEMLRLELRHVTAAVRGGLCRLYSTASSPHPLTVQMVCTEDIFLTAPGVPLVDQQGIESIEKSRERLLWNGDRNAYPDVDVFWMARSADSAIEPDAMGFAAWKAFWGLSRENQPSRTPLSWKHAPGVDKPPHAQTPGDYALDKLPSGRAADEQPGCRAERLPLLPPEPTAEHAPATGSARHTDINPSADRG
ncbi:MAG: serine/threonine-protein kinase [Thermoguttaceae bacterium]